VDEKLCGTDSVGGEKQKKRKKGKREKAAMIPSRHPSMNGILGIEGQ